MTQTMKNNVKCILTLVALLLVGVVGVKAQQVDGYYSVKNNGNSKYLNVVGRKTVAFVDETADKAGTVIRVKSNEKGQLEVLRSQAVDIPHYAERAMSYVPELVKAIVERLNTNLIGEAGANLISEEIINKLDYHLYLESAGSDGLYRLYGKTPGMDVVVEFYKNNKDLIDSRLQGMEGLIQDIINKIQDRLGDQYNIENFTLEEIWEKLKEAGYTTLPEPTEENLTAFFEAIFTNEALIWDFAHNIFMKYWDKIAEKLKGNLGDYDKFIDKVPYIRPNCKYYFATDATGLDFVSQDNYNSEANAARTTWTLDERKDFTVNFDKTFKLNDKFYTTLYVDFAYILPEGVKAYKVTEVTEGGSAVKEEITGIIPAQTPVLLEATSDGAKTITLSTQDGTALADNNLEGNDWLINKYELNAPQVESFFIILSSLSQSLGEQYDYLKRKNAGTVNNKYFFGLSVPTTEEEGPFKDDFMNGKIKVLAVGEDGQLAFYPNFNNDLNGNEAFLFAENGNPIFLSMLGDVKPNGKLDIADINAIVEIILGQAVEGDNHGYDFKAANVNKDNDGVISIADLAELLRMIINKN